MVLVRPSYSQFFCEIFLERRRRRATDTHEHPDSGTEVISERYEEDMKGGVVPSDTRIARTSKVGMERMGWDRTGYHLLGARGGRHSQGSNKIVVGDYLQAPFVVRGGRKVFECLIHIFMTKVHISFGARRAGVSMPRCSIDRVASEPYLANGSRARMFVAWCR
jgi:hypothetical protein